MYKMNYCFLFIIVSCCLLFSSNIIFAQEWKKVTNDTEIFEKGYIQVIGVSAKAQSEYNALRAATVVAQRDLLEVFQGVTIRGTSTIKDGLITDSSIQTSVSGFLRGAVKIGEKYYPDKGYAKVCLRLNLRGSGGLYDTIMPSLQSGGMLVQAESKYKALVRESGKDGLIIDLRDKKFRPAIANRILTDKGEVFYDHSSVSPSILAQRGSAGYSNDIGKAKAILSERGADNILIIKAEGVKNITETEGVIHTLTHEIKDKGSELYRTWAEYIDSTIRQVNNIYAKKVMLFLSKERYKEWPRNEIREHIGWPPDKDRELEEKLATLEYDGLVTRGSSDFHYQGIQDDILDLIFRDRYQYEIEAVSPDISGELANKIKKLEKKKKSLEGALNELKGCMLELVVWRELNKCRKESKGIKNFSGRLRKISDKTNKSQAEKMKAMAALCEKSKFNTVWMNYYIQLPHAPISEVDVLAEGENEENIWALVFEIKNRGTKNPPTIKDAEMFAEKVKKIKEILEKRDKKISFVCPVYFSAEGFDGEVESWLHTQEILTADMKTWEMDHIGDCA